LSFIGSSVWLSGLSSLGLLGCLGLALGLPSVCPSGSVRHWSIGSGLGLWLAWLSGLGHFNNWSVLWVFIISSFLFIVIGFHYCFHWFRHCHCHFIGLGLSVITFWLLFLHFNNGLSTNCQYLSTLSLPFIGSSLSGSLFISSFSLVRFPSSTNWLGFHCSLAFHWSVFRPLGLSG